MSSEGFRWFEVSSSGGQGAQRGDIAWPRVAGAVCAGEWNGCAAARVAAAARGQLTVARRLFGVEMRHPGVEKDVTVLCCKSAAERDVGAGAAHRVSSLADTAVAVHGCRPQHHASAPIKACALAAAAAAACLLPFICTLQHPYAPPPLSYSPPFTAHAFFTHVTVPCALQSAVLI